MQISRKTEIAKLVRKTYLSEKQSKIKILTSKIPIYSAQDENSIIRKSETSVIEGLPADSSDVLRAPFFPYLI